MRGLKEVDRADQGLLWFQEGNKKEESKGEKSREM